MVRLQAFNPGVFRDDDAVVAEYFTAAFEDPNPDVFLAAVGNVAKAREMSSIAEESRLGRESLYKGLAPGATPGTKRS
jgi:probable addiction module antidote protein